MKRFIILTMAFITFLNIPADYVKANEIDNIIEKTSEYSDGYFHDISEKDWFYKYVTTAYEYGMVSGDGNGTFNPAGNITIAETLTIATRINQKTVNKNRELPKNESNIWYNPYVIYAENAGIISRGKFSGKYDNLITRGEFVYIICNCLKDKELTNENPFTKSIPDMTKKDDYYDYILKAIKSGIVTGKDAEGNFYPNDYITRAEVSTVLTRIIERNERKSEVREVTKEWNLDRIEYYEENKLIRNYGDFNKIFCIFRGYVIGTKNASYAYMYDEDQFNAYVEFLKNEKYIIKNTFNASGLVSYYTCSKKDSPSIHFEIFPQYSQIWVDFNMDLDYYNKKYSENENLKEKDYTIVGKSEWEASDTYLENNSISNYGQFNKIECIGREIYFGEDGVARAKYTYPFLPDDFILYCEHLAKIGSVDPLSIDSNALFLECTHRRRNANIHIYIDLVKQTISIDFEKTQASDL